MMMTKQAMIITQEQQLQELQRRVTPILNVDVVVFRWSDPNSTLAEPEFLIGHCNRNNDSTLNEVYEDLWKFPGGRMRYDESPQEAALRIVSKELPGVSAQLKKIIAAQSDRGYDPRAYGVTLYYLFEYVEGSPVVNDDFDDFKWVKESEMRVMDAMYSFDVQLLPEIQSTITMMNSSQDELLVEVDENNNEIGVIEKRVAHNTTTRFHRAAHIMIFDTQGRIVLQKRSETKAVAPGAWDMPGGHHAAGHTIEQTAQQELMEEMGIATDLILHTTWLYRLSNQCEWVYLYYGISDGPYGFDRNEVSAVRAFDCEMMMNGEYDIDHQILNHVKQYTDWLRFVWEPLVDQARRK